MEITLSDDERQAIAEQWNRNEQEAAAREMARAVTEAERTALMADARYVEIASTLRSSTSQQISEWVDAQVTDFASARTMFKRILVVLAYQIRN